MTDYSVTGAHQLNNWLWSNLKEFKDKNGVKPFKDYLDAGGTIKLRPIIPGQQMAEFTDISGGAPFLVYNYVTTPNEDLWGFREQVAYTIYDNDSARLRTIHGYMVDLLRRMDVTAREINFWSGASPAFDFKYIEVTTAVGPDKYSQEGGRINASVSISCEFTRESDLAT